MTLGPVEFLLIAFPGNRFNGEIVPALSELEDNGTIHIIDLIFVKKDVDGNVTVVELDALDASESAPFDSVDGDVDYLLSEEDIRLATQDLPNNSSAGLLVWENTWAARFTEAVRNAHGEVIVNERIPHAVIEAAFAEFYAS